MKSSYINLGRDVARTLPRTSEKFLITLYAAMANSKGELWPSFEYIQQVTGLHRNTIVTANRRFKELGLITWERGFANQHDRRSNRYQLDIKVMERMAEQVKADSALHTGEYKPESALHTGSDKPTDVALHNEEVALHNTDGCFAHSEGLLCTMEGVALHTGAAPKTQYIEDPISEDKYIEDQEQKAETVKKNSSEDGESQHHREQGVDPVSSAAPRRADSAHEASALPLTVRRFFETQFFKRYNAQQPQVCRDVTVEQVRQVEGTSPQTVMDLLGWSYFINGVWREKLRGAGVDAAACFTRNFPAIVADYQQRHAPAH